MVGLIELAGLAMPCRYDDEIVNVIFSAVMVMIVYLSWIATISLVTHKFCGLPKPTAIFSMRIHIAPGAVLGTGELEQPGQGYKAEMCFGRARSRLWLRSRE